MDKEITIEVLPCTCGNPEWGFDCTCQHSEDNPGDINFSCQFCGLYVAGKPRCNYCEVVSIAKS